MTRLFRHGDLRLYLLKLLDEEPRHGYDIIVQLESRFLGLYSPSAGTIYPRLAALEEEGFIEVVSEEEGKKVYRLTEKGRAELVERAADLREIGQRVATSAREVAREIRNEVKASVRDLRREVKRAAREARVQDRRRTRITIEVGDELKGSLRTLADDLESFKQDVVAAAREHGLDADRLRGLGELLQEARIRVIEILGNGDDRGTGA